MSRLDLLPNEILNLILGFIPDDDYYDTTLSRLLQCNRSLRQRVEPMLYWSEKTRSKAMRLACHHGFRDSIRRLVCTYGASPSVVTGFYNGKSTKELTLYLATEIGDYHPDAFKLLLNLGANADKENDLTRNEYYSQIVCLVKRVSINHVNLLHPFFKSGVASKAWYIPVADECLVLAILHKASLDTVQLLLEYVTDINRCTRIGTPEVNALAAAAMIGSTSIIRLLLENGALTNTGWSGARVQSPFKEPVIAAAQAMARYQSKDILQPFLDHGASLSVFLFTCSSMATVSYPPPPVNVPLTAYLDGIEYWHIGFHLSPLETVSFLLQDEHYEQETPSTTSCTPYAAPTRDAIACQALADLFIKWGAECLEIDDFFNVAKLIASYMSSLNIQRFLKRLLALDLMVCSAECTSRLFRVLDNVFAPTDLAGRQQILHDVVADCTDFRRVFSATAEIVIDYLISLGTDINAPVRGDRDTSTALLTVCQRLYCDIRMERNAWFLEGNVLKYIEPRGRLLEMIVSKGADPRKSHLGRDAFDELVRGRSTRQSPGSLVIISHLLCYLYGAERDIKNLAFYFSKSLSVRGTNMYTVPKELSTRDVAYANQWHYTTLPWPVQRIH